MRETKRYNKKHFIHILILIFSLFIDIPSVSAKSSITLLLQQCEKDRSTSSYRELTTRSKLLVEQASAMNEDRALGYGYFYQGLSRLFTGKGKEALPLLDKAWELSRQVQNDTIGALVMNARGIYQAINENNRFLAQNYFFRSLDLATKADDEKMKVRVYGNLLVLADKRNTRQTLVYAQSVYQYGVSHHDKEQESIGAYYLATYYYGCGKYDEAEKYVALSMKYYQKEPFCDVTAVYTLHSKILEKKGKLAEAMKMAEEAVTHAIREKQASLLPDAYLQCGHVARSQANYQSSNQMVMKALEASRKFSQTNHEIECYQLMADNLMSVGNHTEAAQYLMKANLAMQKLSDINMDQLMHERKIMDQMQQKEQQAEMRSQQVKTQRMATILLSIIVLVLVITLLIIVMNYRSRMKLVQRIVSRNVSQIERIEYLSKRLESLETENHDDGEKAQGNLLNDEMRINVMYDRICDMMQKEKLYKEAQLTRERMATLLGTNRTYLSQVIKEKSGMGYQQFVNSYRINEAARILSDASLINYPLKQIWSDLGFSSASTFYKLFIQQLGITPNVYRKQFAEMSKSPDHSLSE